MRFDRFRLEPKAMHLYQPRETQEVPTRRYPYVARKGIGWLGPVALVWALLVLIVAIASATSQYDTQLKEIRKLPALGQPHAAAMKALGEVR